MPRTSEWRPVRGGSEVSKESKVSVVDLARDRRADVVSSGQRR